MRPTTGFEHRFLGTLTLVCACVFLGSPSSAWAAFCAGPPDDCDLVCPTVLDCDFNCSDNTDSCNVTTCSDYGNCPLEVCQTDGTGCLDACFDAGATCSTSCNNESNFCTPGFCEFTVGNADECISQDGWYDVGGTFTCPQGGDTICECQDQEFREHFCGAGACDFTVTGTQTVTVGGSCMVCDDGNLCTDNGVNVAGDACEFTNNTFSDTCYTGPGATKGVGICSSGMMTCSDGSFGACIGEVTPEVEVCDGLDNDCDGDIDEGCSCMDGDVQPCYTGPMGTAGIGTCRAGSQTCLGGVWGACMGEVTPTAEVCDGDDNDCDGIIDDFVEPCYTGSAGTEGVGECAGGVRGCTMGTWSACGDTTPVTEVCGDGLDNDCDGVVDNGCPMCSPEVCDGVDNDCDGVIDEDPAADSSCAAGETCSFGQCFEECSTTADCMGTLVCYDDSFRCDDPDDPCTSLTCVAGDLCFGGSCFTECTSDAMCDPLDEKCYQSNRCVPNDDPCFDVQCEVGQVCYGGSCFDPCGSSDDCSPPDVCWDGRCAPDPCSGVDCPIGQECSGGSCFDTCTDDAQCGMVDSCFGTETGPDGRCATDACDGITCADGQICVDGGCFDPCSSSDECTPPMVCWDGVYCAEDPCDGKECATSETCVQGTCFVDCAGDGDCAPDHICPENRCVPEDDEFCGGHLCAAEQKCSFGECFDRCPCPAGQICVDDTCFDESCSRTCPPGHICHRGQCFLDCSMTGVCEEPLECFDGRCAASMCEAIEPPELFAYTTSHPWISFDKRVRAYQRSTPWILWRPFEGSDYRAFVNLSGTGSGASSNNPLHEAGKAKAVIYLDNDEYVIWLTHGATSGQGEAEAVYSMRIDDTNPSVLMTDDEGLEGYKETDSNPRHIQAFVKTGANETGGIVIGEFPADEDWKIKLYGDFHGDIHTWEMVNGESGEVSVLKPGEPLVIRNEPIPPLQRDTFSPSMGDWCQTDQPGICSLGTYLGCQEFTRVCVATVVAADYEFCDGIDNTCTGSVDSELLGDGSEPDLRVPMVFARNRLSGYTMMPTYDAVMPVVDILAYTPSSGDDRLGSTTVTLPDGSIVQTAHRQSHVIPYRNLQTGRVSFVFVHGKPGESSSSNQDHEIEFEFEALSSAYDSLDHLFVSWYEDRLPGSTDDKVLEDFDPDSEEFEIEWKIERNLDGATESDALVLGLDWLGELVGFKIDYDHGGGASNAFDWLFHTPTVGTFSIDTRRKLRVQIRPRKLEDTICATGAGSTCEFSSYACVGGQLRCPGTTLACGSTCEDKDGDGFFGYHASLCPSGTDCDDEDDTIYPDASEICNGLDNDCDGFADSTSTGCPGTAPCGPAECNFNLSCICPDGPEFPDEPGNECFCGSGLEE